MARYKGQSYKIQPDASARTGMTDCHVLPLAAAPPPCSRAARYGPTLGATATACPRDQPHDGRPPALAMRPHPAAIKCGVARATRNGRLKLVSITRPPAAGDVRTRDDEKCSCGRSVGADGNWPLGNRPRSTKRVAGWPCCSRGGVGVKATLRHQQWARACASRLDAAPSTRYTFRYANVSSFLHGTAGLLYGSATPSTGY